MEKAFTCWALLLMTMALCPACKSAESAAKDRPAAVAGSFYSSDSAQLTRFVDAKLSEAGAPVAARPIVALVSPHAGYDYSGGVAAYSYAQLKGRKFKRVVVIGPSHFERIGYSSVFDGNSYSTPIGRVAVDQDFARKLAGSDRSIRFSSAGHEIHQQSEHSIEVQLPFLQRVLGEFALVPIVMGDQSYEASRALGLSLAKLLRNSDDTLLVASSDLSHYHPYADASRMDGNLLNALAQDDFLSVSRNIEQRVWEACGAGPIVAVMIAAERLGAAPPKLLKYANSGDVTGDKSRVVGYGAVAFYRASETHQGSKFTLGDAERSELLRIARASVESAVREHRQYEPAAPTMSSLLQERGVFVTLKKHGELRGCIGYTSPHAALYMGVRDVAVYAALRDPRFSPVKPEELSELEYEISVLSPFQHVLKTETVRVGEHGLLVRRGDRQGVLLPQVPVEQHWDRRTFLEEASAKAGLPADAWQDPATDVFTFTALVFSEPKIARERQ